MGYLGGKFRVRYQVSEYINALSPVVYQEPFCGYCWVGERVRARTRHFSDFNEDVVLMWKALMTGWEPPTTVSEKLFKKIKKTTEHSALRGFVGTACTFACDMAGGYARDAQGTNYALIRGRQLLRRVSSIKHNAVFSHADYLQAIDKIKADVIYLDPPYANTQEYNHDGGIQFDYASFWDEVRQRSDGSRRILVSEYTAPDDFTLVLQAKSRMGLRTRSDEAGMVLDLRAENLYEYQPPKGRSQIAFSSFLEE